MERSVIKKNGLTVPFSFDKIKTAVTKSADRCGYTFDDDAYQLLESEVESILKEKTITNIVDIHHAVEVALEVVSPDVAKEYKNYRNYKTSFAKSWDEIYKQSRDVMYLGDRENANFDSSLNSTKGSLIKGFLTKELYKKFELRQDELQAITDGYIYIHDLNNLLFRQINCCLFDVGQLLSGGFTMSAIEYMEPKCVLSALQVIGDIALNATAQQFGGWTVAEIDRILIKYVKKSIVKHTKDIIASARILGSTDVDPEKLHLLVMEKVEEELIQGFQSIEMKLNTVPCSRGDFAFTTLSFGNVKDSEDPEIQRMIARAILTVRMKGQGKHGRPVVFPKLVYLYSKEQHKEKEQQDLFDHAILCTSKAMYPDYLSIDSQYGDVSRIFNTHGVVTSPMGCVEGREIITYKDQGVLKVESFERMWNSLALRFTPNNQFSDTDAHLYMIVQGVEIYDSKHNKFVKVEKLIRNTSDSWVKVKTRGGRVLTCTPDHPLPTQHGRIQAKDLVVKEHRLTNVYDQYTEGDVDQNEKAAWLLGLILCDGCYSAGVVTVSIHPYSEDDIEQEFHAHMFEQFGVTTKTIFKDRGANEQYKDLVTYGTSKDLIAKLNQMFGGYKKVDRHIPNEVFTWNKKARLAFLAGMIDADGYIAKDKSLKYCKVQIGSTNKELALQEAALAQSLGMPATVYESHYTSRDPSLIQWGVEFYPTDELIDRLISSKKRANYIKRTTRQNKIQNGLITSVECFDKTMFSYDVTTESDYFDVSHIVSHNCRAYLSEYIDPETNKAIAVGRANIGAVSLNLPMIWMKAKEEGREFLDVLHVYLEMIRNFLKRRYDYLSKAPASSNPLVFTQGGLYKGYLKPDEPIGDLVKSFTASFGITALNELNALMTGKQLHETGIDFVEPIVDYINDFIKTAKDKDGYLYALYGTPAESLCGTQLNQFKAKYGVIQGVSDRAYFTNSFHMHVSADIDHFTKQDMEFKLFHKVPGGHIVYNRVIGRHNLQGIKQTCLRGMDLGLYQGFNYELAMCDDCGADDENDFAVCPKCGSHHVTTIGRLCGYLGMVRTNGSSRFNDAKLMEFRDRISM